MTGYRRLLALLLLVFAAPCLAQDAADPAVAEDPPPPPPPPQALYDFEGAELSPAWSMVDAEATLAITNEPQNVASGNGALELTYQARRSMFQQVVNGAFGADAATTLTLKVKASSPTAISLGVQETNGAMYQALLCIGAGEWVTAEIPLRDLLLSKNGDDTPGATPGEINGFFLADLANLDGETGQALGFKEGEQKIWLDDVALVDTPKAPARGRVEKAGDEWTVVVDDFESDVFWGLPIRQAELAHTKGAPKAKGIRAMEITYSLGTGRWVGCVMAPPGRLDVSSARAFRMLAHTDLNARLVIVLEERSGAKYETAAKLPADGKWQEVVIPLDEFVTGGTDQKINASEISRVIALIDTFDADVRPGGKGSVVIDDTGFILTQEPPTQ